MLRNLKNTGIFESLKQVYALMVIVIKNSKPIELSELCDTSEVNH